MHLKGKQGSRKHFIYTQFDTKKRGWEEVRKKYYNVKSRSKEKLDSLKRPKTGGGPPLPPLTEGEETFLRLSASEPNIHGLEGGIDTDAISPVSTVENISSNIHVPESTQQINAGKSGQEDSQAVIQCPSDNPCTKRKEKKGEAKRRRPNELEDKNYNLDNERIEEEILKIKEEREVLAIKKEVLLLQKQKLVCEIQASYPSFLTELSAEL